MRRMICLLLTFALVHSLAVPASASEATETYHTIKVEYSDRVGQQESLRVMVRGENVYVDARSIALRLGYEFGENDKDLVIFNSITYNGLPCSITRFEYGSTKVSHMLFSSMVDTYEAPFACVKNSEGSWIPLEYSLLILNSGMMIADDTLLIDIPSKRIIDYFYDVAKNSGTYSFDWANDFGYSETDVNVLGASSHLVNVFNGVLDLDGASWATLFQQFAGRMDAYDRRYGEDLALLLCTESDKELEASIESVSMLVDLMDDDGKLGKMLSRESKGLDRQVRVIYGECEKVLQGVKSGNTPLVAYNRSYQALEKALDKQTWFSKTGGAILSVQQGVSDAVGGTFTVLDKAAKILEIVGYVQEFQKQDDFSLAALTCYLDTANGGLELPNNMRQSMADYAESLSGTIGGYMTKRFLDNIDKWATDYALEKKPLFEVIGMQAAEILFAWNIASNTIPFISNGLSAADEYELALYSQVFQGDTHLNYIGKRDSVFSDDSVEEQDLYELSQYCYVYLKTCYVTREAALASLEGKSKSTKKKIEPLIEKQSGINAEIARIMVALKGANVANDGYVFGFLPSDNEDYLSTYDDSALIRWLETPKTLDEDAGAKLAIDFVRTWYDDWSYDGTEPVDNVTETTDRCLPLIDEESSLYEAFDGVSSLKLAYQDVNQDYKGILSAETCVSEDPVVVDMTDNTYRVSIWFEFQHRSHEASWYVTLSPEGKVTDLEVAPRGPYALRGTMHVHEETLMDGSRVSVASLTLDEPVEYMYEYKDTCQGEAHDVLLEVSSMDSYGEWASFDGQRITVECEVLHGAYHNRSNYNVDTLAIGSIRLIGSEGSSE